MRGRVVTFGEVMLRLSPPVGELLLQSPILHTGIAGAEANVAVALAHLGHHARLVTALPENPLGDGALAALRGHGVGCEDAVRRDGRMASYYVVNGAGLRPSEVLYDRAHSVFAQTPPETWDWPRLLTGADRLHLSGITLALGQRSVTAALDAAAEANQLGIPVSFDGNYRARLWEKRTEDSRSIITEMLGHVDLFFGNDRDAAFLLNREFSGEERTRRQKAAEALLAAFPNLTGIVSTARRVDQSAAHCLGAIYVTLDETIEAEEIRVADVVDRVGSGDAFTAGVLHRLLENRPLADALRAGLALGALKHSVRGDQTPFDAATLDSFSPVAADIRR